MVNGLYVQKVRKLFQNYESFYLFIFIESHLLWWNKTLTEQSKCPGCALDNDQTPRISLGYGRGGISSRGRFPAKRRN